MYRFFRITDLGILHFHFSSKNCSSKVYTCFEKVEVLVAPSTTKLSFHFSEFSVILYGFFKVTAETQQGVRIILRRNPWNFLSLTRLPSTLAARPSNPKNPHRGTLGGGGGSPPTMWARLRQTCGTERWWLDRRCHRRAAATDRWWCDRGHSNSGEDRGGAGQRGAQVASLGLSGGVGMVCWLGDRAESGARRRRQWVAAGNRNPASRWNDKGNTRACKLSRCGRKL
jgi:hypothetical protein